MVKKKTVADRIINNEDLKKLYEGIFNAVDHEIGINLYTKWKTLDYVTIINENDEEVAVFDHDNHTDMIYDVKKTLIKNKAFVKEITVDENELVLHITTDLNSLMLISNEFDEEQLQEILEDLEENKPSSEISNNIEELTQEILNLKAQTTQNIIEIGRRLIAAKESLPHGAFGKWLEEKVDFTQETARKFMNIAKELSNSKATCNLGSEKLFLLTKIPSEQREEFIETHDIEKISTRQLQKAISATKKPKIKPIEPVKTESNTNVSVEKETVIEPINVPTNMNFNESDIDKIWEDTVALEKEIKLCTGGFYNDINSDLKLTDTESLLITRFDNKEITHYQLGKLIEKFNLNIPFIYSEPNFIKFINSLEVYNSYSHSEYIDGSYVSYYSMLEEKELSYSNVVEAAWADTSYKGKELEDIKEDALTEAITKDNYTITKGYIETTEYICLYIDKQLVAHYNVENDYISLMKELFTKKQYDKKYLKLVDKFHVKQEKLKQQKIDKDFRDAKKKVKFIFEKENECYILDTYGTDKDCIKVYKDKSRVAWVILNSNLDSTDLFYVEILDCKYQQQIKDKVDDIKHLGEFHIQLKEFVMKKRKEQEKQRKKQEEQRKKYSSYDWGDLFGTGSKAKTLDIFNVEEQKLIKEILEDKELWKKVYKGTAIKIHPDRQRVNGEEAVARATEKIKLLNAVNQKIIS